MNSPDSLAILELNENVIESLDGLIFPHLLRELHLSGNEIVSLKGTTFPELEVLDVSYQQGDKTISLKDVIFPSTLRVLRAGGNNVEDWWQAILPDGLE